MRRQVLGPGRGADRLRATRAGLRDEVPRLQVPHAQRAGFVHRGCPLTILAQGAELDRRRVLESGYGLTARAVADDQVLPVDRRLQLARRPEVCLAVGSFLVAGLEICLADARFRCGDGEIDRPSREVQALAITAHQITQTRRLQVPETGIVLSPREVDVLEMLAANATNRAIAEWLDVDMATVKSHVTRVLAKLGVRTRYEAAERARELGLGNG